jgi:hypothetical protein
MNSDWLGVIEAIDALSTQHGMMARMMWDVELR